MNKTLRKGWGKKKKRFTESGWRGSVSDGVPEKNRVVVEGLKYFERGKKSRGERKMEGAYLF